MQITLETNNYSGIETDALVTYLFEDSDLTPGQAGRNGSRFGRVAE